MGVYFVYKRNFPANSLYAKGISLSKMASFGVYLEIVYKNPLEELSELPKREICNIVPKKTKQNSKTLLTIDGLCGII